MDIYIKKLIPSLVEDYIDFFDETLHSTNNEEHRCYCVCWCNTDYKNQDFSSAQKRRDIAKKYVTQGNISGYLAYYDNKVVGWCNANTKADCFECFSWQMFMGDIKTDDLPNTKVKSIFCFAIAPEFRGKGIAKRLLEKVCEDAKNDGFDYIECYPNKSFINTEDDFMGPIEMYKNLGFDECYETEKKLVMRKQLY